MPICADDSAVIHSRGLGRGAPRPPAAHSRGSRTKAPEREAYEKSREFKDGQRFRAGIEGRISVLFRGRGMKRCLAEGRDRFELWVAAAVLANNLMKIAALLAERSSRRRKAA
jgi:transposase, IS5 family